MALLNLFQPTTTFPVSESVVEFHCHGRDIASGIRYCFFQYLFDPVLPCAGVLGFSSTEREKL